MSFWSIDLGTSNTAVARWNPDAGHPDMIHFEELCREPEGGSEIDVRYSIPSSVFMVEPKTFKERMARWSVLDRWFSLGRRAYIGRAALERDRHTHGAHFVQCFKPALMRDSYRTLARMGGKSVAARSVAKLYLRELMRELKRLDGRRPKKVVVGTPVDCYEPYRAVLKQLLRELGVGTVKFVDEPVAAALGYGLKLHDNRPFLVVDFGAGTLDLALIRMDRRTVEHSGTCRVLAKEGLQLGGNQVDAWLLEHFCRAKGFDLQRVSEMVEAWWARAMLSEARSVKERLFFEEKTSFFLEPPEGMRSFDMILKMQGDLVKEPLEVSREELIQLMETQGVYRNVKEAMDSIARQAERLGIFERDFGEVLMVGGSSLLPGIYRLAEDRYGRDRVRAWQPFFAVAYGGSVFADGSQVTTDFITHDYAVVTHDAKTREPQHHVVVPAGTVFPTAPDFWKKRLVPTCATGEPEDLFRLVICELGRRHGDLQEFVWDGQGRLHRMDREREQEGPVVIPLNENDPTFGTLNPPHMPSDRNARLEVSFGINEDRWLVATVRDIKTDKMLMEQEAVVRLK